MDFQHIQEKYHIFAKILAKLEENLCKKIIKFILKNGSKNPQEKSANKKNLQV